MKPSPIPAFRPRQKQSGLSVRDMETLLANPCARSFLEMLEDGVLVLDGAGRIKFMNQAAMRVLPERHASGTSRAVTAESLSIRSGFDLMPLVVGQSTGVRSLCLKPGERQSGEELRVTLHSLADANGAPAMRVAFLKAPVHQKNVARTPNKAGREETIPIFQKRLEPLLELGFRAFKAKRRILLLGETGVGKTTLAMQMHHQSGGAGRPFIHINCSSISESLFEAEMFGYERGAFTGALASGKTGFIEAASDGTLFLDEIGDMPLSQQAKLLKFLEDGTIQPVGSPRSRSINVYVACATNKDLAEEVAAKRFREDLYYRIAMIPLEVPPLRSYRAELPVVIDTMIGNLNLSRHKPLRLSPDCRAHMIAHDYPGNMRELIGLIARLDVMADEVAEAHHLPNKVVVRAAAGNNGLGSPDRDQPLRALVQAYERQLIEEAVAASKSKREAARALGMDVASLIRKLARDKPA